MSVLTVQLKYSKIVVVSKKLFVLKGRRQAAAFIALLSSYVPSSIFTSLERRCAKEGLKGQAFCNTSPFYAT